MDTTLISFETSKLAFQCGFNPNTPFRYGSDKRMGTSFSFDRNKNYIDFCSYPVVTIHYLQKWLMNEHKIFVMVKHRILGTPENPVVEFTTNTDEGERQGKWYPYYDITLEFGLMDALKKLKSSKKLKISPISKSNFLVDFLDFIRNYEHESGNQICNDERTSEELYQIFIHNSK